MTAQHHFWCKSNSIQYNYGSQFRLALSLMLLDGRQLYAQFPKETRRSIKSITKPSFNQKDGMRKDLFIHSLPPKISHPPS